ncbi:hypothetical protein CKN99_11470 [Carnobacterium maltaromaticum]|uniref:hypothetical protein n=2 Tax=Carnobacterium maltaromaticum TaxID=2751 RepID=UPI00070507F3|nr:hypothetical protein [Carnobacterium maltaromaticum]AOA04010.1 hypothetical protein BFC23_16820 [Carnobacterium maltaromaticum]MDT1946582.1 hypothetical protein [Carnobacterium maltaromaticum]MDT2000967.1 hypothetical protein [Carnobacterium maltaromaticum]TFJ26233.1 hypothetical protein CKN90_11425 [Carnobacterium maltaromaticum]TFJ30739.1 hypothetical protein CKN98_11435 [Carnobacterium maltaromaticum]
MIGIIVAMSGLIGMMLLYKNVEIYPVSKFGFTIYWTSFTISLFYGVISTTDIMSNKWSTIVDLLLLVMSLIGIMLVLSSYKPTGLTKLARYGYFLVIFYLIGFSCIILF